MNVYKNTLFDLEGKVVVVFGGLGQIGINATKVLLSAGANVIIADIRKINEHDDKIINKALKNGKCKSLTVDVTNKEDISSCLDVCIKTYQGVDVVVNLIHYKGSPSQLVPYQEFFSAIENYPEKIWEEVLQTNLTGCFLISKIFGKFMINNSGGVMINTSSTYGISSPNPNIYGQSGINSPGAYAATKSAIINYSRYLAVHWAKYKIRVNCISPGGVENIGQSREFIKNYSKLTPLGRMAKSNEYNGAILFLATDASSYMTGSNLVIDGGWTAW